MDPANTRSPARCPRECGRDILRYRPRSSRQSPRDRGADDDRKRAESPERSRAAVTYLALEKEACPGRRICPRNGTPRCGWNEETRDP